MPNLGLFCCPRKPATVEYRLKKGNLGNQAFEQVKGMILRDEIPAGKRMIEKEIANFMGMSRTPVREAVHKLEAEGFLKPLPKGGYVVLMSNYY